MSQWVAMSQLKTIDTCSSIRDIRLHQTDKRLGDSNNERDIRSRKVLHGLRIT